MPVRPRKLPSYSLMNESCRALDSKLNQRENGDMETGRLIVLLLAVSALAMLPTSLNGQALADSPSFSNAAFVAVTPPIAQPDLTYTRPTEKTKLQNYFFDTYAPYPIVGAAIAAGINQLDNTPPEWRQGAEGYGKRLGSDFSIAAITTTTRYGLAEAFHEDTLYYRCDCKGLFPRLTHAITSTFTSRRGEDGHHVFSFPALVAPWWSGANPVRSAATTVPSSPVGIFWRGAWSRRSRWCIFNPASRRRTRESRAFTDGCEKSV